MPINLATYDSSRADRMSKRSAAGKEPWRLRVDAYVAASYGHDSKPLCIEDIRAALNTKSNVIKNAIAMLVLRGNVRCVGLAENTERRDIGAKTKMYAPASAPLLPAFVAKNDEIDAGMVAEARAKADRRYLLNTEPPRVAEPRVRRERYVGQVGVKYVPEFRELEPDSYDLWVGRNLAMLTRVNNA